MGPVIHVTYQFVTLCVSVWDKHTIKMWFVLCAFRKCKKKKSAQPTITYYYILYQITPLLRRNVSQETNRWMWPLRNEQSSVAVSQWQLSGDEAARTEKGWCVRGDVKMFNFLFLSHIFCANWSFTQVTPLAKPKRQEEKVTTHSAVNLWQQKLRRLASLGAT